jgi:hypothetical protein
MPQGRTMHTRQCWQWGPCQSWCHKILALGRSTPPTPKVHTCGDPRQTTDSPPTQGPSPGLDMVIGQHKDHLPLLA